MRKLACAGTSLNGGFVKIIALQKFLVNVLELFKEAKVYLITLANKHDISNKHREYEALMKSDLCTGEKEHILGLCD